MHPEAGGMTLTLAERRVIAGWAAECAERVLPLFEARAACDRRPRAAIEGARAFALGGKRTAQLRSVAWAAHAAAGEVDDPVATAAARAAAHAAASAYMHALSNRHQLNHVLGSALCQAQARELAAGDDPGIGDDEIRWAVEHAPPAVREVLRRLPPVSSHGRSRLAALRHQLDRGLRS
jgi:hypothetical protein